MKQLYQLTRPVLVWQLLMVLLVGGGHLLRVSPWLGLVFCAALGWRSMVYLGRWSYPAAWIKLIFILACAAGVILSYGGGRSIEGMAALLLAGFSLKLLELHTRRDALVMVLTGYFLSATGLLFEQSLGQALYLLLSYAVITAALLACFNSQTHTSHFSPLRRAVPLLLQATPLMLLLFMFVPRLGPLWQMPQQAGVAQTGLADTLAPGDISQLTRSDALAMRATFEGQPPPPAQRYWRAMTYQRFDGVNWFKDENTRPVKGPVDQPAQYRYQLLMESSGRPRIYPLDYPGNVPGKAQLQSDMSIRLAEPLRQRESFALTAVAQPAVNQLSDRQRRAYLQLPPGNEQTRSWAAQLGGEPEQVINQLLNQFNRNFSYTLMPPRLAGRNRIDAFLFETRRGFCSHFAGASVFVLRAAGIPARMVGGYLGGEWNPYEGYLQVRQYEAHAWVEAWVEGQGWQRIDPTAAVAPERVEQDVRDLFASEQGFLADAPLSPVRFDQWRWLRELRMRYEAANYAWHRFVVGYQGQSLEQLTDWMGALRGLGKALLILLPVAAVLAGVAFVLLRSPRNRLAPAQQRLQMLSESLAPLGLARGRSETVRAYRARVSQVLPPLAESLAQFCTLYESIEYQGEGSLQSLDKALMDCRRQLKSVRNS